MGDIDVVFLGLSEQLMSLLSIYPNPVADLLTVETGESVADHKPFCMRIFEFFWQPVYGTCFDAPVDACGCRMVGRRDGSLARIDSTSKCRVTYVSPHEKLTRRFFRPYSRPFRHFYAMVMNILLFITG